MDNTPNLVQWRAGLRRVLEDLRRKLVGRRQSNYRCLTCRMLVSSDTVDDMPEVTHPFRRRPVTEQAHLIDSLSLDASAHEAKR